MNDLEVWNPKKISNIMIRQMNGFAAFVQLNIDASSHASLKDF